jgi:hypothetical protein
LATQDPIAVPPATGAVAEASPQRLRSLARAAQHDILRRLTPSLRHDMVVPLQSLGMMAEALSARMERGQADADDLQAAVSKLNRLSRQAVARSLEVCTWLDAGDDDTVTLADGVAEVARLLTTSLNFRGFELRTEAADGAFGVSRSAVRFLLSAAVLTLADSAPGPGEITVRTESASSHGVAAVEFRLQQEPTFTQVHEQGEAPLAWPEVHALAQQHGVELLRSDAAIVLRLPRAVVTTPLKMVPV